MQVKQKIKEFLIEQYKDVLFIIKGFGGYIEKKHLKDLLKAEKSDKGVEYILNKLMNGGLLRAHQMTLNDEEEKILRRKVLTVYRFTRLANKMLRGIDATQKKPSKQSLIKQHLKVRIICEKYQKAMKNNPAIEKISMARFISVYMRTSTLLGFDSFSNFMTLLMEKCQLTHNLREESRIRKLKTEQLVLLQQISNRQRLKTENFQELNTLDVERTIEIENEIKVINLKAFKRTIKFNENLQRYEVEETNETTSLSRLNDLNALIVGSAIKNNKIVIDTVINLTSLRLPTALEIANRIANICFLYETLFAPFSVEGETGELVLSFNVITTRGLKTEKCDKVKEILKTPKLGLYSSVIDERIHFKSLY